MKKILLITGCIGLAACQPNTVTKVENTTAAICASIPLAQTAYNVALEHHDTNTVNLIMTTLQASCPAVINLIKVYQQVTPPAPSNVGERG